MVFAQITFIFQLFEFTSFWHKKTYRVGTSPRVFNEPFWNYTGILFVVCRFSCDCDLRLGTFTTILFALKTWSFWHRKTYQVFNSLYSTPLIILKLSRIILDSSSMVLDDSSDFEQSFFSKAWNSHRICCVFSVLFCFLSLAFCIQNMSTVARKV